MNTYNKQFKEESQPEIELERENDELRRANGILKDQLFFFAKDLKKNTHTE